MNKKIYIIIILVFAAILATSTFFIVRNCMDAAGQMEVYDNLAEIVDETDVPKENENVPFRGIRLLSRNILSCFNRMGIWSAGSRWRIPKSIIRLCSL